MAKFAAVALAVAAAGSLSAAAWAQPAADFRRVELSGSGAVARDAVGGAVRLTLDPALQRKAQRLLADAKPHEGAIVASDPRTGRVLVWATRGGGRDQVSGATAPSASLFKVATTAALLDKDAVGPGTRQCHSGTEHELRREDVFGKIGAGAQCPTLGQALGESANAVFARLAVKHLGAGELELMARRLGFAGTVPIDVDVKASTLVVPEGDPFGLARAAAGFWNGRLSPLGALFAMQTIANDGERVKLQVLGDGDDVVRTSMGRALSADDARVLARMLENTTRSGTSARFFKREDGSRHLPGVAVAAKTGTLIGGKPSRMYSWFAGFAPSMEPKIVVSVMLGNDVKWRTKASEVARDLLVAYFEPEDAPRSRRRPTARR